MKISVGMDSFAKLRTNDCYYVDKTEFIETLLNESFEAMLFTRPRRFGKTLMMSMLAEFFDISKDNQAIFQDLSIYKNKPLCAEWMNQYPVIFLTLKAVEGLNFQSAYAMFEFLIAEWCISHRFLLESEKLTELDKEVFEKFMKKTAQVSELKNSLYTLSRLMTMHYGKNTIILIDEYDVPIAKANENHYYVEMTDFLRTFLGTALKTNMYLKFAIFTGCLRIAKESIFTGLNNFIQDSISKERYSKYFGFTEKEVLELLKTANFLSKADIVKKWYDGYCFGKTEMYCPWDVLNYVRDLQTSENAIPENYWKNTSHNDIIRSFINRTDLMVNDKFEQLLSGGMIQEKIVEDLTYDVLHSSEENLWSILYLTGYLTQVNSVDDTHNFYQQIGKTLLKIPNEEIKTIFAETIATWFSDNIKELDRTPMFDAFWEGQDEQVSQFVTDLLFETISYYDYKEDYYHAFLTGIFTGAGYIVESNREYGLGRPDIVVKDKKNRRVLIIEIKHSKNELQMSVDVKKALKQIDVKQYAKTFLKGYRTILCYGAAFFEKECMIRKI